MYNSQAGQYWTERRRLSLWIRYRWLLPALPVVAVISYAAFHTVEWYRGAVWRMAPKRPHAAEEMACAAWVKGSAIICGGGRVFDEQQVGDTQLYRARPIADIVMFAQGAWMERGTLREPRRAMAVAVVGSRAHFVGGLDATSSAVAAHEVIDLESGRRSYAPLPPIAAARAGCTAVGRHIFVVGGVSGDKLLASSRVHSFDTGASTWQERAPLPKVFDHVAAASDKQVVYVAGSGHWSPHATFVLALDVGSQAWRTVARVPAKVSQVAIAFYEGTLLFAGGVNDQGTSVASLLAYSLVDKAWSSGEPLTVARADSELVLVDHALHAIAGASLKQGTATGVDSSEFINLKATKLRDLK